MSDNNFQFQITESCKWKIWIKIKNLKTENFLHKFNSFNFIRSENWTFYKPRYEVFWKKSPLQIAKEDWKEKIENWKINI